MAETQQSAQGGKFVVDKAISGGVCYLTLRGTLNVDFVGRKLAKSITTKKLVINMRHVRRFASWGMSEWMDFLRMCGERDVYVVECSAYALTQLNLVTGLLGHAKLVSFYAPFRCTSCGVEHETLFLLPRDRDTVRRLHRSEQPCQSCGQPALLEDQPAEFYEVLAGRPSFDIEDEVLAFLRSALRYDITPDVSRFRAYRGSKDSYTYLRLSGSVDALPADVLAGATSGTTVVDLEGIVFDPDLPDLQGWDAYVAEALDRVTALHLMGAPLPFLALGVRPEHLKSKVKIRTFSLAYDCQQCGVSTPYVVDVADNLEQLAEGITPTLRCPSCHASVLAGLTAAQSTFLRMLPVRDRDPALDKFLAAMRALPQTKLENCLAPSRAAAKEGSSRRSAYVGAGVAAVLLAGLGAGAYAWTQRNAARADVSRGSDPDDRGGPELVRPEWIFSSAPSSAYCQDAVNRLVCVGVSPHRVSRDEALVLATDAALEELANTVALRISDPFFRDVVMPKYGQARATRVSDFQNADLDRKTDPKSTKQFEAADEALVKARKRVVEALRLSGGAVVPTQRSDWYWEEYAGTNGRPNDYLVFVRYDVSVDVVRSLVTLYSTPATLDGTAAITAFPQLAWQYVDFKGGAMLTLVDPNHAPTGLAPQQIVTAVADQPVLDAQTFVRRFKERAAAGPVKLTVTGGDGVAKTLEVGTK
jgi:hypothetical protein